jgi:hypothetical protein
MIQAMGSYGPSNATDNDKFKQVSKENCQLKIIELSKNLQAKLQPKSATIYTKLGKFLDRFKI